MPGTGGEQLLKAGHIDVDWRSRVELYRVAGDEQPGRVGFVIVQQLAQLVECLTQAVASALIAVARPKNCASVAR